MKFYIHHHEKLDGRSLWLYSEEERTYNITNDLEPLEKETKPFKKKVISSFKNKFKDPFIKLFQLKKIVTSNKLNTFK